MTFAIHPGSLDPTLQRAFDRLDTCGFSAAMWSRRVDVWSSDNAVQQSISARLGWLDAADAMGSQIARMRTCAAAIRQDGFTDVVLLGMGGSSLAPEVLRAVIGPRADYPRLLVLDSIDPDAVRPAMERAGDSLFIVSSKSGTTIEVTSVLAEAERRVKAAGKREPGTQFIAITDPDTSLHKLALDRRFRDVFVNPSDVGGRYSALTFFGLVPAALMGVDIDAMLASARSMADACRVEDPRTNPGLALGAMMAAAALNGRDKLMLNPPDWLEPLGLWIEQLVAESTGKQGKGIVPVAGDRTAATGADDRLWVVMASDENRPAHPNAPAVILDVPDATHLGAEFFRWEVATATAGFLLDVNPFDEPNVQQAKDATRALLSTYEREHRLPVPEPDETFDGVRLSLSDAARSSLGRAPLRILSTARPHDYVALLVYLPANDNEFGRIVSTFRAAVATATGCATTVGYGPRYLHSTGQLHKGGPDTGVFVLVTAEPTEDLPIPGEAYSFGLLEMAQATGDFQSLNRAGRRALHLHLPRRDPTLLQRVTDDILRRG